MSLTHCAGGGPKPSTHTDVVVSVKEQKLAVYNTKGTVSREFPVSTSKFGLSDRPGTYSTPLGLHEIVAKIGHGAPAGAVFKNRRWTGEVIKPDSPGRDPIVSRIMWLRGMESINRNAYARYIYIHGTAEERNIGKPVSYGCIRMKSRDVIELFNSLPIGSRVLITKSELPITVPTLPPPAAPAAAPASQPPIFLKPEQQTSATQATAKTGAKSRTEKPIKPTTTQATAKAAVSSKKSRKTKTVVPTSDAPKPSSTRPAPSTTGTVLYSAPSQTGTGATLKSQRKAMQGISP
ncbi:MAG: L,D-transpeptidase family protein [Roseimicrobium sp.]